MEGVFFISFYETMLLQQKQLQQKLTDIQKQLQQLPEGKLIVDAVPAACGQHGERQKAQRQYPFFLPMIIHIYHSFGCSSEVKLRSLIFHIIS